MGLFPVGHERLARVPRKEMEDTLCEILCSVIPIQRNKKQIQPARLQSGFTPAAVFRAAWYRHWSTQNFLSLHLLVYAWKCFKWNFWAFIFLLALFMVAATLSVFCSLHSWLSIVKQPLSHYLPLWTQKNMKSILHAFQAGKFCYWAYCFIMVSIIDIYELWNKT